MFPINTQLADATKASLEAQFSILAALTAKSFESIEKVVDLNLNAARATLEDSTVVLQQLLSSKDPQDALSRAAAQAQPTAAKAIAYSRHLAGIVSSAQAEFSRVTEEQVSETGRKVSALIDDVSKNAPAGSENVIAIMKSAIGNASAGYEQLTKTTKQAVEVIEANMSTAVNQFSQAAEQTAANVNRARTK
jgi:phasin family protein